MTLFLGLAVIAALVALSVLISMSEISFAAARDSRMRSEAERGDRRAIRFLALRRNSGQVITVLQICLNAVGVLGGIASNGLVGPEIAAILVRLGVSPERSAQLGALLGFCLVTFLFVLFADLLPKRVAMLAPDRVALAVGWFPQLAVRVLFPFVWVFSRIADAVLRAMRIPVAPTADHVTPEDLRAMLAAGTASGVLLEQEHRLIQNVLGLQDRWITSAMTPRDDIVYLDIRESLERQREKVRAKPYSRYPLCDGGLDRVIGSIRAEDVLAVMVGETAAATAPPDGDGPAPPGAGILAKMRRDVLSLPETLNLWQALGAFEQHGAGFALIVSEYAVVVGVVTFKDIMGALMDGLANPFEEQAIVRRDENSWLVDGIADLGDVARALGLGNGEIGLGAIGAQTGAYETIGGFVMHKMRRVARKADRIEAGGFTFEVVDVDGFRINQLLVTRKS
ncbi:hemolysin family protein [Acetobacteraceae bacterium KSS8]|uniref:Polyamine export protein n=1 Tax=Endosaccharibacter trunci TaxID=2812733 RepID=A0ABT1W6F2_9PROT|nr:hemolysin family protein [Acetobacteraceae bacterium KSS8]